MIAFIAGCVSLIYFMVKADMMVRLHQELVREQRRCADSLHDIAAKLGGGQHADISKSDL